MIARTRLPRLATGALCAALVALLLLFAGTSRGDEVTTLTVTTLEDEAEYTPCEPAEGCTLREAITTVNEAEAGEEFKIAFAVEGTIALETELRLHPEEEEVEVEIEGPGAAKLTIDASGTEDRVLMARSVGLRMSGLTITGGEESGFVDGGGGILVVAAGATLTGVHVTGNQVEGDIEGGGIAVENGASLELVDSLVDHNVSSEEMGGGIYVEGASSLFVEGATIEANEAQEDAGGGIAAEAGALVIQETTISGNKSAEGGGGLWIAEEEAGSEAEIIASRIEGNHSDSDGGGLKSDGGLLVKDSTFAGNSAGDQGGGLYVQERTTVATSTVAENEGGGIAGGGTFRIRNATIVANEGGAGVDGNGVGVVSSVLFDNTDGVETADCAGTIDSEGHNLLGSESGCTWNGTTGDQVGADPLLAPLGDYGGATPTMPPESRTSPAINHGAEPQASDQRGRTRPVPTGPANTDVGAVEVQAPALETEVTVAPTEDLEVGETLTCAPGSWDADTVTDPTTAYAWIADPEGAAEQLGSESTLTLSAAMAGREIVCEVTTDNGAVAVTADSAAVELDPAVAVATPSPLDLGGQRVGTVGTPAKLTVTASGGVPLEVTAVVPSDPAVFVTDASDCVGETLSHASCEIAVTFAPNLRGEEVGQIEIQTSGNDPVVTVTGIGIEPVFGATPAALSFAPTEVGDEAPTQGLAISNQGNGSLTIGAVQLKGAAAGDFRLGTGDCEGVELDAGESCAVEVTFAPTAPGEREAELVFAGADGGSVALSGTALAPGLSAAPAAVDFGAQTLGAGPGAPRTVVLSNPGSVTTQIASIAIVGPDAPDFSFAANGCIAGQLAPGAECALQLVFEPPAVGASSATLVVAGTLEATIPLSGLGVEAAPPAPAPRLKLQRGKGPLTVSGGVAKPRFTCVSERGSCAARLALLRAPGAGAGVPRQLGAKQVKLGAGQTRGLAIPLGKAGRRALAAHGRLAVVLAIEAPGATTRVNLSLRG